MRSGNLYSHNVSSSQGILKSGPNPNKHTTQVKVHGGSAWFCRRKGSVVPGFSGLTERHSITRYLERCIGPIESQSVRGAFQRWGSAALPSLSGQQVCLDGKILRGSREGDKAVHLMSAFAAEARWVLAQQAVGEKSNEITAIPDLLSKLDIQGALISIDAMGARKRLPKPSYPGKPITFWC